MTQKQYHFGAAHTLIAFKVGQPLGYSPRSFSFTPNTTRLSPVSQCVFIFCTCLRFVHVFQYASLYLLRFRMKQITLRAFWIADFLISLPPHFARVGDNHCLVTILRLNRVPLGVRRWWLDSRFGIPFSHTKNCGRPLAVIFFTVFPKSK